MAQVRKKTNRNKLNLLVDIAIFVAFLIAMAPHFSGTAIHEWLSIAFGAAIVTHLLLHWQWLVEVTRRFFTRAQWSARINYILNAMLFIDMTVVIYSGLLISRVALPQLGIHMSEGFAWRQIHDLSANVAMLLLGGHIALHWQWIVQTVKRFVISPLLPKRKQQPQIVSPTQQEA